MKTVIIDVKNIKKQFKINKRSSGILDTLSNIVYPKHIIKEAVNDISFKINEGEMVGFIGPNGAGKSTTIKMLSGILYPDGGSIVINKKVPYKQRKEYVADIGVVFGQKSQLSWDLPVIDSFELLKHIYKIPEEKYKENLATFTKLLDMEGFINQPVRQLSLGQRMRADIVAALLHSPKIVFFDEPTIGLDVVGKEKIRDFILHLNKTYNTTMIFTTHDMQDIVKTCNRIIIIDKGKILYDGTINEIRERFGTTRQINVEFETSVDIEPIKSANIIAINNEKRKFKIIVDISKASIEEVISILFSNYSVSDITITEPEIDSIICKIYEGGI